MSRSKRKALLLSSSFFVAVTLFVASFLLLSSPVLTARASSGAAPEQKLYTYMPLHHVGSKQALTRAQIASAAVAMPTWSSSFSYQGQNYPYTILGTNPSQGSQTTTITVNLVPISFTFSNGLVINGSSAVSALESSPLFSNASFVSGNTQYVDAMQRAAFWQIVSATSPNYHVLLTPVVQSTVSLTVGSNGSATQNGNTVTGSVDIGWLGPTLDNLAISEPPADFTIFVVINTEGTENGQCCYGGYHTAITDNSGNVHMYAFADTDASAGSAFTNFVAYSHEMEEWANNPILVNTVPSWESPLAPQYGCSNALEVGDPLAGYGFTVNGYTVQDEAFFSWFTKSYSSLGYQGQFDYQARFSGPAPDCNGNPPPTPTPGQPTPTPTPGRTPTPTPTSTPIPTPTASATPPGGSACAVSYVVQNQWPGGFTASLTITNTGSTALNSWTLTFTFPGSQQISQLWNGNVSQSGASVTITNVSYNGQVPAGSAVNPSPGFNGSWNGSNPNPTSFKLNGVACSIS
ncbi:MAG TPA: cellulose-binding domain-containing protein [Ktedonobacteraceae bacterium]|nr:cellulose-binding domain-containing protein [Ktedonobacteraceae bacterium]